MSPRYDIPKTAPEPLRQVQQFINSVDLEHDVDWMPDWLRQRGLERRRGHAIELREALRSLVLTNNGQAVEAGAVEVVNRAAARLSIALGVDGRPRLRADGDALDEIVAIALAAMLDGSWARLKACRNCRWSFYDYSPNRSATWCSMQLCGNRRKTRAYRRRHAID